MRKITQLVCLFIFTLLFTTPIFSQDQNGSIDAEGDIAFVAYHADNGGADQEDGFSFILLDDAPDGTAIRFIDEEWNGTSFIDPMNEGEVLWQNLTGSTISAGTVITITDADGSGTAANIGTATEDENGFNLGSTEDFFAIIGTRASPTTFLTAHDGNDGITLITSGTSLTSGQVLTTTGQGRYTGSTVCNSSIGDCLTQIYDTASNWTFGEYTHSGTVVSDFTGSAFSGGDTDPPGFSVSPAVSGISQTGFTVSATIDETGDIYYVVVADGATAPTVQNVLDGQANGGGAALASGNATGTTSISDAVSGLTAGTAYDIYVVARDDEGTPNVQASTTLVETTTSAAIALTVTGLTGDNKVYDGTTAATATGTASLSGVVGGDDVSIGGSPVFTFASANVGTGITINTTGYTISGTDAGKYSLTQPTLSADITAATLTVSGLTGDNKVYDGTTAATATGTATLSGVIGADDVSIGGSPVFTFASANVGTGITINTSGYTISGTDSGNYTLTQPTLSADITAAELTVVGLTGDNKVYDGTTAATATGTATLSGVIGADDVSIGGSPVFTFASANVGTGITINTSGYTISGTDSGNYTLTQPTDD